MSIVKTGHDTKALVVTRVDANLCKSLLKQVVAVATTGNTVIDEKANDHVFARISTESQVLA